MAENNIPGLSNVVTDYLDNLNKGKAKMTYRGKYGDVSMSPRDKLPPTLKSQGLTPEEDKLTWGDWHPETIAKYPEEYAQMRIDQHNKYNQGFIPDKSVKYADMVRDRAQNILIDAETNQLLDDARTKAIKEYDEGKAQRDKEAKEAEEAKHRKAEKMWSAIGDGISAIANMATVGAGADSMYNPADSLHSKVKSKWDEIKANKAAIAAAENKARMDLLLADLGYQHASAENAKNRQSKWDEFYTKLQETNRHNQEMEAIARDRAESYETNAQANKTRASKYKGGGSSGGGKNSQGKWELVGPDGKTEYYDTQAEWEARAKEIAPEVGVSLTTNSGWKRVKKDAKQVVAEVNAANKKKAEKPTGKKLNLLQ